MHQVKLSAIPCFLIDTGCRCRKKFVSITTTRLRRSSGAGWRKMLFQICDSRMISLREAMGSSKSQISSTKSHKNSNSKNVMFETVHLQHSNVRHCNLFGAGDLVL